MAVLRRMAPLCVLLLAARAVATVAGDLDPSFGAGGRVVTDLDSDDEAIHALVAQPDGKLIAAGHVGGAGGPTLVLARYDADGHLDPSFGPFGTGLVRLALPVDPSAGIGLLVTPDGKVVSGGAGTLVMLDSDGVLDAAFSADGVAELPGLGALSAIVAHPAGGWLVGDGGAVARVTAAGELDPSFGSGGTLRPFGAKQLVALADGGVAGVGASTSFDVWRATASGILDLAFDDDGSVLLFPE